MATTIRATTAMAAEALPCGHHQGAHLQLAREWTAILVTLRRRLHVPIHWQITLSAEGPDQLPGAFGDCSWEHLAYDQYAIRALCSLDAAEAEWTLCHELLELTLAPLAEFTWSLMDEVEAREELGRAPLSRNWRATHDQEHRLLRDKAIEQLCRSLLGHLRPQTLSYERHIRSRGR